MQHASSHQRSANAQQPEPAWEMVRRWPGMRGEDKLAWLYLWQRSRGGREQIDVTPNDVAADQNVSSDAGRQRFKNLDAAGLILVKRTDRATGLRTIEMPSPRDVSRARRIEWDGQSEFGFMGSPAESEEGEPSPATSRAESTDSACAPAGDDDMDVLGPEPLFVNRTEVPRSSSEEAPEAHRSRTEQPRFAAEEPTEVPRYDAEIDRGSRARVSPSKPSVEITSLPYTFESPSPSLSTLGGAGGARPPRNRRGTSGGYSEGEDALVADLCQRIRRKVRDDRLRMSPMLKVARAVIRLQISLHDLETLLDSCAARKFSCPPSAYAIGGFKKLFERAGLDWNQSE